MLVVLISLAYSQNSWEENKVLWSDLRIVFITIIVYMYLKFLPTMNKNTACFSHKGHKCGFLNIVRRSFFVFEKKTAILRNEIYIYIYTLLS